MNPENPDASGSCPERAKPPGPLARGQAGPVEGDVPHNVCLQCGCEMNLVKTKWICPECHWIIGCCD